MCSKPLVIQSSYRPRRVALRGSGKYQIPDDADRTATDGDRLASRPKFAWRPCVSRLLGEVDRRPYHCAAGAGALPVRRAIPAS